MRLARMLRYGAAGVAFAAIGVCTLAIVAPPAQSQSNLPQDGRIGFVLSDIAFALSPQDASQSGACPNGMSLGPREIFEASAEGRRREGESDADYTRRVGPSIRSMLTGPNGQNLCMNPEAGAPDPHHQIVTGVNVPVDGVDLDGQVSRANGRPAAGTCAHDDFRGALGERGVDNQFYRAIGCLNSFQATAGQSNSFAIEMLTGSWGVLITLDGVDNLRNDNNVDIGLFANADPIELSPNREALPNATYAIEQDARYQTRTRGRIVNGVLTTEPANVRIHWVVNTLRLDRTLRDARIHATIAPNGAMEGYLSGYAPVEEIYDTVFGFRNGRDGSGELAPLQLRQGSSSGYAFTARHTCNGVYHAIRQLADGYRDPVTGQCTAISTQYRIRAVPAFVVNAQTTSANQDLVGRDTGYGDNPDRGPRR